MRPIIKGADIQQCKPCGIRTVGEGGLISFIRENAGRYSIDELAEKTFVTGQDSPEGTKANKDTARWRAHLRFVEHTVGKIGEGKL